MGRTKPKASSGQPIRVAELGFEANHSQPSLPIRLHPIHPFYPCVFPSAVLRVLERSGRLNFLGLWNSNHEGRGEAAEEGNEVGQKKAIDCFKFEAGPEPETIRLRLLFPILSIDTHRCCFFIRIDIDG